jgi:hypothetical protein
MTDMQQSNIKGYFNAGQQDYVHTLARKPGLTARDDPRM